VRREDERAEALSTASAYRFVRLFSRNRSSLSQSRPLRSSLMPDEDASIECQRTRARWRHASSQSCRTRGTRRRWRPRSRRGS